MTGWPNRWDRKWPRPGIGFSIGEDRLVMSVEESKSPSAGCALDLFIAPMGEAALRQCGVLARELRGAG